MSTERGYWNTHIITMRLRKNQGLATGSSAVQRWRALRLKRKSDLEWLLGSVGERCEVTLHLTAKGKRFTVQRDGATLQKSG